MNLFFCGILLLVCLKFCFYQNFVKRKIDFNHTATPAVFDIQRVRRQTSLPLISKKDTEINIEPLIETIEQPQEQVSAPSASPRFEDARKRNFLKFLGVAGLGVAGSLLLPKRADALVFGSTPASNVVGVKNTLHEEVNPATEESLQALLEGQSVEKMTISLSSSGNALVPGSGKKIRVYSARFSLTADLTSVSFRFTSGGVDYERYVSPKAGGLYGANNHPNYVEGGVDEPLYVVISGTGTVQINIDYIEI